MYTIPLIPNDLRHEETIAQAANALDCVQKTINSIFERIDERVERNSAKVQQLGERISRAQAKINGLTGTKKAVKIYAPARFPASASFRDIPQTFPIGSVNETNDCETNGQYEVQSRVEAPTAQTLNEKLVFFHVRSAAQQQNSEFNLAASKSRTNLHQGLGGVVPEELRSVSSLLRFNTNECVYGLESAAEKDNWKRSKNNKAQRQRILPQQKQLLEPAPHSLANRGNQLTPSGGLRYTPRLHEAPEINLPLDLPDLPGIADDIHFEGKAQQQIAPSLFIENLPELPELVQQAKKETTEKANVPSIPTRAVSSAVPPTPAAAPPPPPPPPPVPAAAALPPPPPPPPPAVPSAAKLAPAPASSDTRSELMAAIRKGCRLRSAAAAPVDAVDNHASSTSAGKAKPSNSGDLMADLHIKLQMRRKGISGAKENNSNEAMSGGAPSSSAISSNPVISRLSALIPPPAARKPPTSDDDEEDNDDADWTD